MSDVSKICQWGAPGSPDHCGRPAFWAPAIVLVSSSGRAHATYLNLALCLEHRNGLKIDDLVSEETFADFWARLYPVLMREPCDVGARGRMRLDFTSLESDAMRVMSKASNQPSPQKGRTE